MDFTTTASNTDPDTLQDEALEHLDGSLDHYMVNLVASPHAAPALPVAPIAPPPPAEVDAAEEKSRLDFSTKLYEEIATYDFDKFALGGMAVDLEHPRDRHTAAIHLPHISVFLDQIKASVDGRVRNLRSYLPLFHLLSFLSSKISTTISFILEWGP